MRPARNRLFRGLTFTCVLTLSGMGCTTVRVTKIGTPPPATWHYWVNPVNVWNYAFNKEAITPSEQAKGLRFHLPKPYILVKPNNAGGIEVEPIFLPDQTEEYAVETSVYLASQNFSITIDEGMLKKVTYKPDQTAVLSELAKSAGAVSQEVISKKAEQVKAKTDQAKKTLEERQKKKTELDTAQAELERAQFALTQANVKLSDFDSTFGTTLTLEQQGARNALRAAIREAEFEVRVKNARVTELQQELDVLTDAPTDASVNEIFPVPGAILFEVLNTAHGAELKPVEFEIINGTQGKKNQLELETFRPSKIEAKQKFMTLKDPKPDFATASQGKYLLVFLFSEELGDGEPFVQLVRSDGLGQPVAKGPPSPGVPLPSYYVVQSDKLELHLSATEYRAGSYEVHLDHKKLQKALSLPVTLQ